MGSFSIWHWLIVLGMLFVAAAVVAVVCAIGIPLARKRDQKAARDKAIAEARRRA